MAITLRARPTCHYCGKRNGPTNNQRKFTCQHCSAENYLDESGQVTDVPASAVKPPTQYAIPGTPAFAPADDSIFCSTCQKNQYMYNTALSEYLPDPDHPEYDKFEAAIPAFKKDLERRFPTCCSKCEPRVKAQLQQATYNARSDHVRRVLERSRQRRIAKTWGWRSLLVNTAGLGWLLSLLTQLLWHALGSQTYNEAQTPYLSPKNCLQTWPVPAQCPQLLEWIIGPAIFLGLICVWWNPKWQHKLEGREGRLADLEKYYEVQGLLLALRFAAWTVIKDVPNIIRFRPMIHAVSLVLVAMVAGWSYTSIIKICLPQIVDWSQSPAPLLDRDQFVPPSVAQMISPPNSQDIVPMNIFNTAPTGGIEAWRPPTPPVDEDAMEWDPTPTTFSPVPKRVKYKSTEPTPFQGTLPAFPRSGIYQTRQETAVEQPQAIGIPMGFFDKSHGKRMDEKRQVVSGNTGLSEPKFFPDVGRADTGLEGIFDKVFSIRDEAAVPTASATTSYTKSARSLSEHISKNETQSAAKLYFSLSRIYNMTVVTGLVVYAISILGQTYLNTPLFDYMTTKEMLDALAFIPLLSGCVHVLTTIPIGASAIEVGKVCIYLVETIGLALLASTRPCDESLFLPLWNKLLTAAMAVLVTQEVYNLAVGGASHKVNDKRQPPKETSLEANEPRLPKLRYPTSVHEVPEVEEPRLPVLKRAPRADEIPKLRRSLSDESLASDASFATTSTASGWKTPQRNHRDELHSNTNASLYALGGLSLSNDFGHGSGNNVAAPRNARTPASRGQRGW